MSAYIALKNELTADPLGRGYASMSDAAAATSLNAVDVARVIDADIGDLFALLLQRGVWPALRVAAVGTPGPVQGSAQALIDLVNNQRLSNVRLTDPVTAATVAAQLGALVAAGVMSAADETAIMSLGSEKISRATQIGWPADVPLTALEVAYARAMA